jgi:hypothetical protein
MGYGRLATDAKRQDDGEGMGAALCDIWLLGRGGCDCDCVCVKPHCEIKHDGNSSEH